MNRQMSQQAIQDGLRVTDCRPSGFDYTRLALALALAVFSGDVFDANNKIDAKLQALAAS